MMGSGSEKHPVNRAPFDAFEAEALPHMDDLFRAAVRLVRDHSKASDAVQDAYLLAWKTFDRYQRGTNCRAWLFQILFNVVRHERRNWFKWMTGKEEDVAQAQLVAAEPIPEALTDQDILSAMDSLPVQFREVLLLVDVEEFSYREASEILQVPIGTVMSRLNRGRGLLRGQLSEVARAYGINVLNKIEAPGRSVSAQQVS
jgi:RNA polymerase sigma-70 factor (ECF subfamily)